MQAFRTQEKQNRRKSAKQVLTGYECWQKEKYGGKEMEVKTGNTNEDRAEMNKSPRDL